MQVFRRIYKSADERLFRLARLACFSKGTFHGTCMKPNQAQYMYLVVCFAFTCTFCRFEKARVIADVPTTATLIHRANWMRCFWLIGSKKLIGNVAGWTQTHGFLCDMRTLNPVNSLCLALRHGHAKINLAQTNIRVRTTMYRHNYTSGQAWRDRLLFYFPKTKDRLIGTCMQF